ncbi:MAG: hypothetical protein WB760_34080 [Xanthobacteraceae bacterium]
MFLPGDKSTLELLQLFAGVAAGLVAAAGFSVGIWAIFKNAKLQREQTARNAYVRYLERAFENPYFACPPDGANIDLHGEMFGINTDLAFRKKTFAEYEWFISSMLNTADFIWESVGYNHVLAKLMRLQVAYHWEYFDHFNVEGGHKEYLKLWYGKNKRHIDDGISLGKRAYPLGPGQSCLANSAMKQV